MTDLPRDGHGQFVRTLEQMEFDRQCAMLRSKSMTYQQIGDQMGVSKVVAIQAVQRAMKDVPKGDAEALLNSELDKLDQWEAKTREILDKKHYYVTPAGKVANIDGELIEDDSQALQAIGTLLKISERRARLLGLNAPARTEVTGKDGAPIQTDTRALVLNFLQSLASE